MSDNKPDFPKFFAPVITTGDYTSFPTDAVQLFAVARNNPGKRKDAVTPIIGGIAALGIVFGLLCLIWSPMLDRVSSTETTITLLACFTASILVGINVAARFYNIKRGESLDKIRKSCEKIGYSLFESGIGDRALSSLCFSVTEPREEESKARTIDLEDWDCRKQAYITLFRDGSGDLHVRIFTPFRISYPRIEYYDVAGRHISTCIIDIEVAYRNGEDAATFNIQKLFPEWQYGVASISYNTLEEISPYDDGLPSAPGHFLCNLKAQDRDTLLVYTKNVEGRRFEWTVNVKNFTISNKREIS